MINKKPSKRRHKTVKKTNNFKSFFTANILNILGVLFLGSGLFYLINSYFDYLYDLVYKGFMNGGKEEFDNGVTSKEFLYQLMMYYSSAIVGLIACVVLYEKIKKWVVSIAVLLIFYLVFFQFKIGFPCNALGFLIFPNFYFAASLLFITTTLLCIIYLRSRSTLLFFFILVQFYASLIVLRLQFPITYLIPFSFVFSFVFCWVGNRARSLYAPFINLIFAVLFFSLFYLKNIIFESVIEYIDLFLVFSLLFYVLFIINSFSKSFYGNRLLFLAFSLMNSVFYFTVNALLLRKYYDSVYVIVPILVLLFFQYIGIYYIKKNRLKLWLFPMELILAVLFVGLFIVTTDQNGIAFIFGAISIVLLKYALIEKNNWFLKLSFASIMLMTLYAIFLLIGLLTALFSLKLEHVESLFIDDLLNGFGIVVSLYLLKKKANQLSEIATKKEFNTKKYLEFLNGFLLITVFLLFEGISSLFIHALTQTFLYSSILLFLFGGVFFWITYKKIVIVNSTKVFLGMILFFILLFPLTEYFDFPISKSIYLLSSNFSLSRIILHYIGLFLFFAISIRTVKKLYQINVKNSFFLCLIDILSSLIFILMVCKEYDFISSLFSLVNNKSFSILDYNLLLESNQILPYSILILIVCLLILIYGVKLQNRFLKAISIVFAGILFANTFLFGDDDEIYQDFRVLIFFVLGIMLILFSWTEKQLKKKRKVSKISTNKRSEIRTNFL